jgi:hypothetical protein
MGFATPLHNEWLNREEGGRRLIRLLEPLVYVRANGERIVVPAEFVSDGASIPRLLRAIFSPYGLYLESAVLHDYLYNTGLYTRAESDAIFREAMASQEVVWAKRETLYRGVRVGGWRAWGGYRRAENRGNLGNI